MGPQGVRFELRALERAERSEVEREEFSGGELALLQASGDDYCIIKPQYRLFLEEWRLI
jgi:hypothetical protein